jgi:hypothetical protein
MSKVVTKSGENGQLFFLIPLDMKIENQTAYLDITKCIEEAKKIDEAKGYPENGLNYGFEVKDASDYATYVNNHASPDTLSQFNTTKYSFFVDKNS